MPQEKTATVQAMYSEHTVMVRHCPKRRPRSCRVAVSSRLKTGKICVFSSNLPSVYHKSDTILFKRFRTIFLSALHIGATSIFFRSVAGKSVNNHVRRQLHEAVTQYICILFKSQHIKFTIYVHLLKNCIL